MSGLQAARIDPEHAPTIGILGAAGQTGLSIVNGLLSATPSIPASNIISLTRPESASNAANTAPASRGVPIRPFSLTNPHATLVASLSDITILISCMSGGAELLQQIPLATAAKEAGVQRFLPSAWLPVIPPGGVHIFRDLKEQVYAHVKSIGLPYTIVDVGWWYQIAFPRLPSGKIDYAPSLPADDIFGTGEAKSALTDLRDVGRYVARVVADERTVDKFVLCYNEVHAQLEIFDLMERLSGETIPRNVVPREEIEADIAEALALLQRGDIDHGSPEGAIAALKAVAMQYAFSWGVRGDNTPENAKALGYVTSKELWPEMGFARFEGFLKKVMAGKGEPVFEEERRREYRKAMEFIKEERKKALR